MAENEPSLDAKKAASVRPVNYTHRLIVVAVVSGLLLALMFAVGARFAATGPEGPAMFEAMDDADVVVEALRDAHRAGLDIQTVRNAEELLELVPARRSEFSGVYYRASEYSITKVRVDSAGQLCCVIDIAPGDRSFLVRKPWSVSFEYCPSQRILTVDGTPPK